MTLVDILGSLEIALLVQLVLLIPSLITYGIFRNRLKTTVKGWIDEGISDVIGKIQQNPAAFAKILAPLLQSVGKEFGIEKGEGTGSGTINIFGLKVPKDLVMTLLPMFVKGGASAAGIKNPLE